MPDNEGGNLCRHPRKGGSMIEVLEFIFQSFWTFAGTCILLLCIGCVLEATAGAIFRRGK